MLEISRIEHYEAVRGTEQEASVTERDSGLVQEIIHQSRSFVENLDGAVLLIVPHKSLVGTEPEIAEIIRPGGEENFGRQIFDVFPVVGAELPGVSVIFVETGIETDGPEVAVFVQTEETISGMLFPCQCPVTVSLNWSYASTPWLYEATQMVPSPSSAIYSMARSPRHSTFLNLSAAGSYAITPTEVQRKIFRRKI